MGIVFLPSIRSRALKKGLALRPVVRPKKIRDEEFGYAVYLGPTFTLSKYTILLTQVSTEVYSMSRSPIREISRASITRE